MERNGVLETTGNVEPGVIIRESFRQRLLQSSVDGGGDSARRSLKWSTVSQGMVEGEPGLENRLSRSLAEITFCHLKYCSDTSEVQIME